MTKSSENGTEHLIEFVERFIRKKQNHKPNLNLVRRVLSNTSETLENAGHVSPRIWEITKDNMEGGAVKSEVYQYLTYPGTKTTCLEKTYLVCVARSKC